MIPLRSRTSDLFVWIGLSLIAIYFCVFAGGGVTADFSPDDLMNLHHAQVRSAWQLVGENVLLYSGVRPLGGLFYKLFYEAFRLYALPIHIAGVALAGLNVWILYLLSSKLSGSREIGIFVALLGAFHTNFLSLYYNTGMCYDLLAFPFYYGALIYYVSIRERERHPNTTQTVVFILLYVCALNAKEISITLPLLMVAYELIYRRSVSIRNYRTVLLAIPFMAIFAAGRVYGPEALAQNGEYKLHVSASMYLRVLGSELNEVFYRANYFTPTKTLLFCAVLLIFAFFTRSAYLWFSAAVLFIGILPIAFITPRGLYAAYLPITGLWPFAAVPLVRLREAMNRVIPANQSGILTAQLALFLAVGALLIRSHMREGAFDTHWITDQEHDIRHTIDSIRSLHLPLPHDARVLILHDPYESQPWGIWISFFLFRLYYHDVSIEIEKCSTVSDSKAPYAAVIAYVDGELTQVTNCVGKSCCALSN